MRLSWRSKGGGAREEEQGRRSKGGGAREEEGAAYTLK
jgi:hypothetical protein